MDSGLKVDEGSPPGGARRSDADHLPPNLLWSVFKNTAAQAAARLLIAGTKFAVYVLVVRTFGAERFGEYSLILALLVLMEWILDFGLNDIFVREMCQRPEKRKDLLRTLAFARVLQAIAAYAVLAVVLLSLGYEASIRTAGLVAGTEVLLFSGILYYRALFKATLTMECEALAEFAGVVVLVGGLGVVCLTKGSLTAMGLAFVASRVAFFFAAHLLGRKWNVGVPRTLDRAELAWGFKTAWPIGLTGLMVVLSQALDCILLERLGDMEAVGVYASAFRFALPSLLIITGLSGALYPILASYWKANRVEFRRTYQLGIDWTAIVVGMMFVVLHVSSTALMGLFQLAESADALRALAWVFSAMALTLMVAPALHVVGGQKYAIVFSSCGVVIKCVLCFTLVPRFGYLGTAWSAFGAEVSAALLPTLIVVQRYMGHRVQWWVFAKVVGCVAAAMGVSFACDMHGSFLGAFVALVIYCGLCFATGAARAGHVRKLISAVRQRVRDGESG